MRLKVVKIIFAYSLWSKCACRIHWSQLRKPLFCEKLFEHQLSRVSEAGWISCHRHLYSQSRTRCNV